MLSYDDADHTILKWKLVFQAYHAAIWHYGTVEMAEKLNDHLTRRSVLEMAEIEIQSLVSTQKIERTSSDESCR